MDRIYVNENWTFKECIRKVRTLKTQYQGVLMSFYFLKNPQQEERFIRETRKEIYSLQFDEWKKDKIWEYMNDDIEYAIIKILR